jgi:predicted GH43/DUF377 family glycosyl hydrolase
VNKLSIEIKKYGPVLVPKGEVGAIFNCGAVSFKENILLLARVVKKGYVKTGEGFENYISEIYLAKSKDGKRFKLEKKPFIQPENDYEKFGCEDPRITKLGDEYFITYTALSRPAFSGKGERIGLASTKDFKQVKKFGIIGPDVNDKDCVIFPELIDKEVVVLHRIFPEIQIAFFKSIKKLKANQGKISWAEYLKKKNDYTLLKREYQWEEEKIGAGAPPLKTKFGWLLIYHGVDKKRIYRAGVVLLDLKKPHQIIARLPYPILEPDKIYEKKGDVPNVIFPTGVVKRNNRLFIYYGAADKRCCLAVCKINSLIKALMKYKLKNS